MSPILGIGGTATCPGSLALFPFKLVELFFLNGDFRAFHPFFARDGVLISVDMFAMVRVIFEGEVCVVEPKAVSALVWVAKLEFGKR